MDGIQPRYERLPLFNGLSDDQQHQPPHPVEMTSPSVSSDHHYTALDTDRQEIRLLHLLPAPQSSAIECNLETVSLQSLERKRSTLLGSRGPRPRWEALSYTWGETGGGTSIFLNGKPFAVRRNLWLALCSLRLEDESRVIWIDAICVNQSDLEERSQQIQFMATIYKEAERVTIWLGDADDLERIAFVTLAETVKPHQLFKPQVPIGLIIIGISTALWGSRNGTVVVFLLSLLRLAVDSIYSRYLLKSLAMAPYTDKRFTPLYNGTINFLRKNLVSEELSNYVEGLGQKVFLQQVWTHFGSLFQRSWFERTWVIQEAAHATNLVVRCGTCEMPFDRFKEAALWIHAKHRRLSLGPDIYLFTPKLLIIASIRAEQRSRRRKADLLLYLELCRHLKATDARDKIYALANLVDTDVSKEERKVGIFTPDYNMPADQLYMRTTKWQIMDSGKLDILGCSSQLHVSPSNLDLPSWCPDWSVGVAAGSLSRIRTLQRSQRYGSTLDSRASVNLNTADEILCLSGTVFDNIRKVATDYHDIKTVLYPDGEIWQQWNHMALHDCFTCAYGDNFKRVDAYWRTLLAGGLRGNKTDANCHWQFFCSYFLCENLLPQHLKNRFIAEETRAMMEKGDLENIVVGPEVFDYEWTGATRALLRPSPQKLLERLRVVTETRKLCITESGYFGLVPCHSQPGDKICLLQGGCLPFLLRETPAFDADRSRQRQQRPASTDSIEAYKFIGECYIQGLAKGEGMTLAKERGLVERKFSIV